MVNAYKTSFNVNRWTILVVSPTNRHWLIWHLALRQWEHLTAVIDIYLKGCQPMLSLMSTLPPMDCIPCKAKQATVNHTWALRCCSRSRLMAMSCRVIQATIPNRILTQVHSMLVHSPTFLLSAASLRVRSMIPTNVRCLDMACNIILASHLRLLWISDLWTCSNAFLHATIYHSF